MNSAEYYRIECERLRSNIDNLTEICEGLTSKYVRMDTAFSDGAAFAYAEMAMKLVVARHGTIDKPEVDV